MQHIIYNFSRVIPFYYSIVVSFIHLCKWRSFTLRLCMSICSIQNYMVDKYSSHFPTLVYRFCWLMLSWLFLNAQDTYNTRIYSVKLWFFKHESHRYCKLCRGQPRSFAICGWNIVNSIESRTYRLVWSTHLTSCHSLSNFRWISMRSSFFWLID